jgi:hypothetical protein
MVALATFFMSGCSVYTGIAVHHERSAQPEFYAPNPLGIIGGEYRHSDRITLYCEHISSIPYYEKGLGLNLCGARYYVYLR